MTVTNPALRMGLSVLEMAIEKLDELHRARPVRSADYYEALHDCEAMFRKLHRELSS